MNQQFQEKFKQGNVKEYVKPVTFNRDTDNYDGRRVSTTKKPKVIATPLSKGAMRRGTAANKPTQEFEVNGEAQMFDNANLAETSNIASPSKYL